LDARDKRENASETQAAFLCFLPHEDVDGYVRAGIEAAPKPRQHVVERFPRDEVRLESGLVDAVEIEHVEFRTLALPVGIEQRLESA
jgi:hypothetical protein